MAKGAFVLHDFYCVNCGKMALSLPRQLNKQKEKLHRKWLYCPWCRKEINMIECKNDEDVKEFLIRFNENFYKEEMEKKYE